MTFLKRQSMTMTSYSDDYCSHMKRVFGETRIYINREPRFNHIEIFCAKRRGMPVYDAETL